MTTFADLVLRRSGQLLNVHQEPAVPHETHHVAIGVYELRPDRSG